MVGLTKKKQFCIWQFFMDRLDFVESFPLFYIFFENKINSKNIHFFNNFNSHIQPNKSLNVQIMYSMVPFVTCISSEIYFIEVKKIKKCLSYD